jgi:hypothetical protein
VYCFEQERPIGPGRWLFTEGIALLSSPKEGLPKVVGAGVETVSSSGVETGRATIGVKSGSIVNVRIRIIISVITANVG